MKDIPKYADLAGGFIAANSNNFDGTHEMGLRSCNHIMIADQRSRDGCGREVLKS